MRLFGLIGYPLGHSFSEKYFNEKFAAEGLNDYLYRTFPLESPEQLPALVSAEKELEGFNVTIPYKTEVIKYLDELDPVAEAIGAVNTVRIYRDKNRIVMKGYNTDAPAFRQTVEMFTGNAVTSALVLGTGGASLAVVYALEDMGVKVQRVSRMKGKTGLTYDDIDAGLMRRTGLIVNTTPLGMYPDILSCPPIDYSYLCSGQFLYDLVYNPSVTVFMQRGEEHGCKTMNGMKMLHLQADLAWGLWTRK